MAGCRDQQLGLQPRAELQSLEEEEEQVLQINTSAESSIIFLLYFFFSSSSFSVFVLTQTPGVDGGKGGKCRSHQCANMSKCHCLIALIPITKW